jgi:hypothetical protein
VGAISEVLMRGVNAKLLVAVSILFLTYFTGQSIADPIGIVDTVGITWCEKQWGCENSGPQIAIDKTIGAIYIVWSYAPAWNYWGSYSRFNCYFPDSGWVYGDTGLWMFPAHHENHSIMLRGNGGGMNDIEITTLSSSFSQMTERSWWNGENFVTMPLDTLYEPQEVSPLPVLSRNGTVQLLALGTGMWEFGQLVYGRYAIEPYSFTGWQYVDTVSNGTYSIAASPISDKVAISYIRQRIYSWDDTTNLFLDRNAFYLSSPDGQTWEFQNRVNITNFMGHDILRPYYDNDIIYDYRDNLHLAFSTWEVRLNIDWPESTALNPAMCFIWHWNEATNSFTVAADGWIRNYSDYFGFGSCGTSVCKPQLAINPANNYFYMIYERNYPDDYSSPFAYGNSDIWISVSTDNGLNWSAGTNITDTHTPMCRSGQCASEIQASLYDVVDDTLHAVYILDKDAGLAQDNEGYYTQNYVIYQKIPADLIPTTPLLEQFSIREGPPRCHYLIGDINGDGQTNGSDILYAVNYFKGGQLPAVDCDCPDVAHPFFGAGDVNGSCTFNGMDIVFYVNYLKGRQSRLGMCYDCPPDPL